MPAYGVHHHIAGDGEQPHPQAGQAGVEAVGGAPGTEEGLLHDVLREARVAEVTEGEAIELGPVGRVRGPDARFVPQTAHC